MGLLGKVSQAVDTLFDTLKEFTITATLSRTTKGGINPATGKPVTTTPSTFSVVGLLYNETVWEQEDRTQTKFVKVFTCKQSSLSTTPAVFDRLIADGVTYEVTHIENDPANITWTFQLKAA